VSHTLGVDLGGTNMRAAVVDRDGTILERVKAPTPHEIPNIDPFLQLLAPLAARRDVEHAVVGVPARVDHDAGTLLNAPNLPPRWPPLLTRSTLEHELGLPVALANDADLAAVGETRFGAARGHRDVVYVTISTGLGSGILVGGRLVKPRCSAGEVGHTVVDRVLAAAGGDGTVEGLGSGTALARHAHAAGIDAVGAGLVALVEAGDAEATAVWDEAMFVAALAVVNLAHIASPSIVVVGGGVGLTGELVNAPIRDGLARFGPRGPTIDVVTAALGDDPGLIGAAGWRDVT
jgi:glucokinase